VSPEERAAIGALLAAERERAVAIEEMLTAEYEAVVEASAQSNADDEHDPEGATIGFERARVASLRTGARSRISEIDQAIERARTGAYGSCRRCQQAIPVERLTAYPTATACVGCVGPPEGSAIRRR